MATHSKRFKVLAVTFALLSMYQSAAVLDAGGVIDARVIRSGHRLIERYQSQRHSPTESGPRYQSNEKGKGWRLSIIDRVKLKRGLNDDPAVHASPDAQ